jgi:hypothetical protein
LSDMRMQMGRTLTPPPAEIARLAAGARAALRRQVRISPAGEVLGPDGSPLDIAGVAQVLNLLRTTGGPTWESSCHELAALLAAERAARDGLARGSDEQRKQHLADCDRIRQRARQIAASLRFTNATFEWPTVDTMTLDRLAAELGALIAELQSASRSLED